MAKLKGIYKIASITDPLKMYVGGSANIKARWRSHKFELKHNRHHSIALQDHFNKYGLDDLLFEILKICEREELKILEQKYIKELSPIFNIAKIAGSNLGIKRRPETREKVRLARLGKKASEAAKVNMSQAQKGKPKKKGNHAHNAKKIICIETGIIFRKIGDAASYLGMKTKTLNAYLTGQCKNKTTMRYYNVSP